MIFDAGGLLRLPHCLDAAGVGGTGRVRRLGPGRLQPSFLQAERVPLQTRPTSDQDQEQEARHQSQPA